MAVVTYLAWAMFGLSCAFVVFGLGLWVWVVWVLCRRRR